MNRVTADADLANKLPQLTSETEVCTANGTVLGTFTPRRLTYEEMMATCPHSEEELERRSQVKEGSSLGEILARLGVVP